MYIQKYTKYNILNDKIKGMSHIIIISKVLSNKINTPVNNKNTIAIDTIKINKYFILRIVKRTSIKRKIRNIRIECIP